MILSGSLILGAGDRDSQAFWMENLKVSHTEFKVEVLSDFVRGGEVGGLITQGP